MECEQCGRWFKSKTCYDHHKEPVGGGKSVCQGIKKCEKCGKSLNVRNFKNHVCGRKCSTSGVILKGEDEHKCYI